MLFSGFIDVVARPRCTDQLIRRATGTAIVEPICLCTCGLPAPFKAATLTLGVDSVSREPSANRLLWTTAPCPKFRL